MSEDDLTTAELVERSLSGEADESFRARVREQADRLRGSLEAGELDNPDVAIGLEMEVYAVDRAEGDAGGIGEGGKAEDDPAGSVGGLSRLPDAVFEPEGVNKELGLHNVEINTDPDVLDGPGIDDQAAAIEERFERGRDLANRHGIDLVLDAMWTLPPAEGSRSYLTAEETVGDYHVAANMRADPRYFAIDLDARRHAGGDLTLSVPGYEGTFPTILFESLATSIQPHVQVPTAAAFPDYYRVAIRTLGPLLALSANSPFLPADLYGDVDDPAGLVADTHHELRIAVFEQSVNHTGDPKVRVPRDVDETTEVLDRVLADDRYAPFLREWIESGGRETFADGLWELDHKRGTYWRWLRCVIGGDPVGGGDERSVRIEYRPIPTQPTVRDVVGMQALTAGLIHGLVAADHPLGELPWSAAESSFYDAVREGLDAEFAWVSADGERTDDPDRVFEEVFAYARRGLADLDVPETTVERYLGPIEIRWERRTTPSSWKKARVREALQRGADLETAVCEMQREYVRRSGSDGIFADWLDADGD